jgi:hypothetical protein
MTVRVWLAQLLSKPELALVFLFATKRQRRHFERSREIWVLNNTCATADIQIIFI